MPAEQADYLELALGLPRDDFVRKCSFPFLVGLSPLIAPPGPQRTASFDLLPEGDAASSTAEDPQETTDPVRDTRPVVLAVRKAQSMFPNMITVGRTANNDIIIRDTKVSKFHAFFRIVKEGTELYDAGSRNGTWHGLERLIPTGPPALLETGDLVRFGPLQFSFYEATDLWDHLRGRIR